MGKGSHTRTGIRVQHRNAPLARAVLEEALLGAVLRRAGQPRQVDQDGHFLGRVLDRLRWQVQVEGHLAVGGRRLVRELEQLASKGGDARLCRHGHGRLVDADGVFLWDGSEKIRLIDDDRQ